MTIDEIAVGMELTWLHVARGGYGFVTPVHVKVCRVAKKTVRVEAPLRKGGTKLVSVRPENLRTPSVE